MVVWLHFRFLERGEGVREHQQGRAKVTHGPFKGVPAMWPSSSNQTPTPTVPPPPGPAGSLCPTSSRTSWLPLSSFNLIPSLGEDIP